MPCAVSARRRSEAYSPQRFASAKSSVTLLAIGSESRQPVTLDYMARYMLSDLSFDDYLRAGGWRGYAQKAAKDAFVTEARSWLAPLQQMLDAEQTRLLAVENTTVDDLLVVVAIKRQLGTLKRYLKISTDDARRYQTMRVRAFRARQKDKSQENSSHSSANLEIGHWLDCARRREGQSRRPSWGLAAVWVTASWY